MSNNTSKTEGRDRAIKTTLTVLKFVVLLAIIFAVPLLIWLAHPDILKDFSSIKQINELLDAHKGNSALIYIGLQIFQIVVSFIPGQIIQISAGYVFGTWFSYILTIAGIGLGTILTFYLSKVLGKDMVYLIFGEVRLNKFIELLNSKKAFVAIFIIFLFPGIPKDLFVYAAGISKIRLIPFLILNLVARTPALICSLLFGSQFRNGDYTGMIIVGVIVLVIAVFALIFRKRVYALIDRIYNKFNKSNTNENHV